MVFQALHTPTLLVVTAVVVAFSGLVLVFARGREPGSASLALWGAAMIFGAGGLTVLALEPALGAPSIVCGNVMILFGTALSWTGARMFRGMAARPKLLLAGPLGWLALALMLGDARDRLQTVLVLLIGAGYTLAAAAELWRCRTEALRSRHAAVVLLVAHATLYAGRAVSIAIAPHASGPFSIAVATIFMFEALLHTVGMAFMLLAIIGERAEHRATVQLRQLAMLDGLTGLGNRRLFDQTLEREHGRALRDRVSLGLLMIDADHFKSFNDTYGHQCGDDCLRAVADAIRVGAVRGGDTAVRYGGEEFAVLLPNTDEAGAVAVAEAIRASVAALRIEHAGSPLGQVSVSIGAAAVVPNQGTSGSDKLLHSADRALYRAKAAGRNMTHAASEPGATSIAGPPATVRAA